jgi:FAD-dependent urate hydroxylase
MLDVLIIGAGPYGISLAAHAVVEGLSYKLIGYPMDFWKNQMPQNMFIRTPHELVSFSDPQGKYTLQSFSKETGTRIGTPLQRTIFVKYAAWFIQKTGVEYITDLVSNVTKDGSTYIVTTEMGGVYEAKNVIIATGIQHFTYIPEILTEFPESLVTHTSGYTSFEQFQGKNVAVIGSGQSAWEAAALLYEANAKVELIYRRNKPMFIKPNKSQEKLLQLIGHVFFKLPLFVKTKLWNIASETVPIALFLRPYVEGKVHETSGVTMDSVSEWRSKIRIVLSDGTERIVDHILTATGYKMDIGKLPFLDGDLREDITREENAPRLPKLNKNFESSQKGLFFAGPLSSHSHGPTFRFLLGVDKTAKTIINSLHAPDE